jgi:glycosyltransferase involved in cell wall biosynthesis
LPIAQSFVPWRPEGAALGILTHPWEPLQVGLHRQHSLRRHLQQLLPRFQPQVVVLMLSRLGWLAPLFSHCPLLVDFVDSLALNMRQRARVNPWLAPLWLWESWLCQRFEASLLQQVDCGTVVAQRDKEALGQKAGPGKEKLHVVPFGVPVPPSLPLREPQPATLLLTGNLGYFPTVSGLIWFARRVFPQLKREILSLRFIVAGSRPPKRLRQLTHLGIQLVQDPPDLAPWRHTATLLVAPLLPGSGTPIKVLEAMAAGLPVVASPAAAEGLDGLPAGALRLARTSAQWVEAIQDLLAHPEKARQQAEEAFLWVRQRHHLPQVAQAFEQLLTGLAPLP